MSTNMYVGLIVAVLVGFAGLSIAVLVGNADSPPRDDTSGMALATSDTDRLFVGGPIRDACEPTGHSDLWIVAQMSIAQAHGKTLGSDANVYSMLLLGECYGGTLDPAALERRMLERRPEDAACHRCVAAIVDAIWGGDCKAALRGG